MPVLSEPRDNVISFLKAFPMLQSSRAIQSHSGSPPVSDSDSKKSTTSRPEQLWVPSLDHRNYIRQQHSGHLFKSQQQTLATQILSTIENAPTLLQSLHNNRIFLNPKSFNRVLISAAQRNHLYLVTQIFELAIASKIQPLNSNYYLTVAKAFAKAGDCVVELLNFTEQVLELTLPSMTAINRLLFAFGQCIVTDNAILIFAQVKDRNFTPDLYTYNTVFEILVRAGRTGKMLGLFGEMKEAGIDPDLVSYNTVISRVRKFGEVDMCLFYFKEMCEKGVQRDLRTYTAVIDGLGRSGNIEESLRFFGEKKERRIQPSLYLYRAVISNLKKMGKVEMAVTFMEEKNSCASSLASPKWNKLE